jgi:hypothetical protein
VRALMLMTSLAVGAGACEATGPHVDGVEPGRGARGATVVVRGAGFCGEGRAQAGGGCDPLPPGSVVFGLDLPAARGRIERWADDEIAVTVPAAAAVGPTVVVVTVDGRSSNGGDFEVLP